MRTKSAFVVSLLLAAVGAWAQSSVIVNFPDGNDRDVWVASPANPARANELTIKGNTADVPLAGKPADGHVFVLDRTTGNLASKPVAQAKGGWTVKPSDFSRVGYVTVHLTHGDKPVAAAQVSLKDPKRTQSGFLDPSTNGDLVFWDVAPGQVQVSVKYKTAGKDATPVNQVFDLPLKRSNAFPTLSVALPEKVETVGGDAPTPAATTTSPGAPDVKSKSAEAPSVFGRLVSLVLGVGVAAAVIFFGMQYAKKNPDRVQQKLTDLGVQIPQPGDPEPDDPPVAIPPPAAPAPPQKIVLDNAEPDLLPSAPVATIAAPMAPTGQPRLVSATGDELPLDEGDLTVGRDIGLGLSLPSESTVSRNHAVVTRRGATVVVKDLGSTNGTFVNGARLSGETTLRPGDNVQFGAVRFRYEG